MKKDYLIYGGIAAAVFALAWWVKKKGGVAGVAAAMAGGVVDAGAGVVLGIGDSIGVPRTDMTECERAKAEGRWWDASFACPAGDFLSGASAALSDLFGGAPGGSTKSQTFGYDYGFGAYGVPMRAPEESSAPIDIFNLDKLFPQPAYQYNYNSK